VGHPIRRGTSSNCAPARSGILDHQTFGGCGGGHVDISPWRKSVDPIIIDARRLCEKRYRGAGKPTPARCKA
jgi:hypothetical protein